MSDVSPASTGYPMPIAYPGAGYGHYSQYGGMQPCLGIPGLSGFPPIPAFPPIPPMPPMAPMYPMTLGAAAENCDDRVEISSVEPQQEEFASSGPAKAVKVKRKPAAAKKRVSKPKTSQPWIKW